MITEEYAKSVVENWDLLDLGDIKVGPRQCFETIVSLYDQIDNLLAQIEGPLGDQVLDLLHGRKAEQLLTGQEP